MILDSIIKFTEFSISKNLKPPAIFFELVKGFHKRILLKDYLDSFQINMVLDVGANNGGFAKNLRSIGYQGWILSFEPDPKCYEELKKLSSKDKKWKTYNIGLGSSNATLSLNINQFSVMNSFLLTDEKGSSTIQSIDVSVKTLNSFADEFSLLNVNPRIFLKVDTQGYDIEVIKGGNKLIETNKIILLLSEVSVQPLYLDMPHYTDALKFYESLDFELVDLFSVTRNSRGVIEYDALMVAKSINANLK